MRQGTFLARFLLAVLSCASAVSSGCGSKENNTECPCYVGAFTCTLNGVESISNPTDSGCDLTYGSASMPKHDHLDCVANTVCGDKTCNTITALAPDGFTEQKANSPPNVCKAQNPPM